MSKITKLLNNLYYMSSLMMMIIIIIINAGSCSLEENVLRFLCDMIGYPDESRGSLTSGSSSGILMAIATARDVRGINGEDFRR